MNSSGDEQNQAVEPASQSSRRPGHELGAARERAGISLEEMASRLHLGRDSVEAIERDDYAHLPTAAFVRGYLRAYAKEVGMDADALVEEFDAICGEPEAPELVLSEGMPDPASGHGTTLAVLVLVAVALVGAAAWWFQQEPALPRAIDSVLSSDNGATEATGEPDAIENEDIDAGGDVEMDAGYDEPAVQVEATSVDDDSMTTADAETENGEAEPAAAESANATADEAGVDVEETPDVGTAGTTGQTGEPAIDDSTQTETEGPLATSDAGLAATSAANTGPDRLQIEVAGESWIEVYDDRGRRLAYTLYSGSTPVVLNGWAPFDVSLGNSPAVTVRIGDAEIDQSAFVRSDNTARFLADSEGARRR